MTDALSIRRRLVGSSLRRYRESLGYDLAVPARILECHLSKISRIETGQRGIRPKELRELLTEYGVDAAARDALTAIAGDRSWRYDHDQILGSAYCEFLEIEKAASAIFTYAPAQVPQLLQTPDYARAVISADPNVPEHAEAALAAAELARQQAILDERHISLKAVIGEAALQQRVGSAEVTRSQLRYLAEVSASGREISIRILPFAAGEHVTSAGAFRSSSSARCHRRGWSTSTGPPAGSASIPRQPSLPAPPHSRTSSKFPSADRNQRPGSGTGYGRARHERCHGMGEGRYCCPRADDLTGHQRG